MDYRDPYNDWHMGNAAELCVKEYKFSREEQDEFAISSYKKSQEAQKSGAFAHEICAVEVAQKKQTINIAEDEEPQRVMFDKIASLRPAFDKTGSITAANASTINDGAAALVLATESAVKEQGLKPLAKILTHSTYAQDPKWFTTAPVGAMRAAVEKVNLKIDDIDLWEVNEAFSVVTMAAMKDLNINASKMNVHGGAVSLGHPIGASGARILTTLVHALRQKGKKLGGASICLGGGEGVRVLIEAM
ncbi:MAG: thiolase family protein [Bdellovibrionales bacterium]